MNKKKSKNTYHWVENLRLEVSTGNSVEDIIKDRSRCRMRKKIMARTPENNQVRDRQKRN